MPTIPFFLLGAFETGIGILLLLGRLGEVKQLAGYHMDC